MMMIRIRPSGPQCCQSERATAAQSYTAWYRQPAVVVDELQKLRAQIAKGDVSFRVEGVDGDGKVKKWAELKAHPSSNEKAWDITVRLGDGTKWDKSHPTATIEDELTRLMLWIRSAFVRSAGRLN